MVETTTTTLRANALISPTWHRLDMNEAEVDVVDSIADGIEIHVPEGAQEAEFGAFATATLAAVVAASAVAALICACRVGYAPRAGENPE